MRSCDAAQLFERHPARARIGLFVLKKLMCPVRADGDGVKLEGEARGVELRVKVAGFLRFFRGAGDAGNPFSHDGGDAVADDTAAAVELEGSGGEKTSALEDTFFHQDKPAIDQSPQARHSFGSGDGW